MYFNDKLVKYEINKLIFHTQTALNTVEKSER